MAETPQCLPPGRAIGADGAGTNVGSTDDAPNAAAFIQINTAVRVSNRNVSDKLFIVF